jgi:BirA family transcriptional regulator, biotin operon repressor / biotin---[acetyl-CoA-carboxylase] ligase
VLDAGAIATLASTRFSDVTWLAEVTSTNDEVASRARAGAAEGVVVVADRQTAGRGRRGRTWAARPGSSLLVSVFLRPPAPHLAVMAAGLAALDACRATTAHVRPSLKWPNDLVVDDRGKLAGILAEAAGDGVVVGLGLNVDWGDMALPPGATSLAAEGGGGGDRAVLLVAYLVALEDRCRRSPVDLLADYRNACSTIGRQVRVELPGGESIEGRATGVDDDGRLIVDGRAVAAGDVVHVRSAS